MRKKTLLAVLSIAIVACSPGQEANSATIAAEDGTALAEEWAVHPVSGLQIINLTVSTDDQTHAFRVELAATPEAQSRGLMFRTEMGDNEGMLFPSRTPDVRSFWMKNTPISLDIIFIGLDGRVMNIAANTEPYSLVSIISDGIASAVLELRGGRAAELGIKAGDQVTYTLP